MRLLTPRGLLGALLVPVGLLLSALSLSAQDDALRRGIELYRAGRYADAVQPLRGAYQAPQTRDEARPWLIAALGASRQEIGFELQDVSNLDARYGNAAVAVIALRHWANDNRSGALSNVGWFCKEDRPGYDACQRVKQMIEANASPAAPAEWPRIAGLSEGARPTTPAPERPAPQPRPAPRPAPAPPRPPTPTSPPTPTPAPTPVPAGRPLQVGEAVIVGGNSAVWRSGFRVEAIDPATRQVRVRHSNGSGDVVACHSVARPGPADPAFFVGDWEVHVRGTTRTFVRDRDLYRRFTGGVMLPPLRINADGTYSWVVSDTEVIRGRWTRRSDAPGIRLSRGIDGRDWTLFEATEANGTTSRTRDEIGFIDLATSTGHYQAYRIGENRSCVLTGRTFAP